MEKKPTYKESFASFKGYIQMIIDAENREDAIQNVFYGENGIDMAFQRGKISYSDHQMLLALIEKLPE